MTKKLIFVILVLLLSVAAFFAYQKLPSLKTSDVQGAKSAQILAHVDGTDLALGNDGNVVKKSDGETKPILFLPEGIQIEENKTVSDTTVLFALKLLQDLAKSDFTPTQLRFVDKVDVIVYSQSEATARFTAIKDSTGQVDSLQSVLSKAKIDASKISQIDLRFNKPVVTYKK